MNSGVGKLAASGLVVLALPVLALIIMVPMSIEMQLLLSVAAILFTMVLKRNPSSRITLTLVVISITLSTRYLYWRTTETLHFSNGVEWVLGIGLYLAEVYAWIILLLGYFQSAWPLERRPSRLPADTSVWPSVDVYIPTYNESLSVVQDTILAAQNLNYPADKLRIYVLDDGRRPEFGAYAAAAGVGYIVRPDNNHAKAGNLNHAMTKTHGDLICIFDCDHVTTRVFLQATVGQFLDDPKLALVQTPHHFYSPDPFARNLSTQGKVPSEDELFYGPIQKGNDLWNATFFCGSCAIIRRKALEDTNGFAVETVTEDAHTALKLQRKGWNTAFISVPMAAGLSTERLALHVGQRMRWARGMTQIFRLDNPLLGRGLALPQRLCYLNAMLHFQFALPRFVFLTSPLAFLLLGQNIIAASAQTIFAYALPHLVLSILTNARIQGKHRHSFWGEIYETVLAFHLIKPTLYTLFNPRKGKFNVTDKGDLLDRGFFDFPVVKPHLITVGFLCAGILFGIAKYFWIEAIRPDLFTLMLNIGWTVFNMLILLAAIAAALETRQVRQTVRLAVNLPILMYLADGRVVRSESVDISMGGARLRYKGGELSAPVEEIEIQYGESPLILGTDMVNARDGYVQLRYKPLSIAQRRDLVAIVMGRPDAWLKTHPTQEDNPLRSLWNVIRSGALLVRRPTRRSPGNATKARKPRGFARALMPAAALVVVAVLCIISLPSKADEQPLPPLPALPPPVNTITSAGLPAMPGRVESISLSRLGVSDALMLKGRRGEAGLAFSINRQQVVTGATLHLRLSYSDKLLAESSVLQVSVNDELIQNIPLVPATASGLDVDLPINPLLLLPYNRLNLRLDAHYSQQCENPLHPALWARIDPASTLELALERLPITRDLALLPAPFFDEADMSRLRLPVVLPDQPEAGEIESAAMVASWFGMQSRFRGAEFPVSFNELPMGNAVLIGTARESFTGLTLPAIEGPVLAVVDNPRDSLGKLLLVLGRDASEVRVAAQNLVLRSDRLKGKAANLAAFSIPARRPYDAPRWISNQVTRFADLAKPEALTSDNLFPGVIKIGFRAAPDNFLWEGDNVPMRIRFRFPEGDWYDAARSRLDVSLNGQYLSSVSVLKPGLYEKVKSLLGYPSRQEDAVIEVPPYLIYGDNQLGFYYNQQVTSTEDCNLVLPESAHSYIDGDSVIDLSGAKHFSQLPNLSFFVGAGFPFTRMADLSQTALILPHSPRASEIEALLTLMGRFGDATGYPALNATVLLGTTHLPEVSDRDWLVVGQISDRLDFKTLFQGSSFTLTQNQLRIEPLTPTGMLETVLLGDWDRQMDAADRTLAGYRDFQGFVSRQSPLNNKRVVVMALASQPERLPNVITYLNSPEHSAEIRGDIALFGRDGQVESFRTGLRFTYGELPWFMYVRWLFSERPLVLMGLLLLAAVLAAFGLHTLLRLQAHKRLGKRN